MPTVLTTILTAALPLAVGAPGVVVSAEVATVWRSPGWSTANWIEANSRGQAVVAGSVSSSTTLFSDLGVLDVPMVDSQSSYAAALRPDGFPEWVLVTRGFEEGAGASRVGDVSVAADDEIVVAGTTSGDVVIDGPLGDIRRSGPQAIFIMSLAPSGAILEMNEIPLAPGFGDVAITDVSLDGFGGMLLGGWTSRDIDFTPTEPGGVLVPVGRDGFVVRLDSMWRPSWVAQVSGDAEVQDIAVGPAGEVLFTGSFRGLATVTDSAGVMRSLNSTASAPFVINLDTTGQVEWVAQSAGGGSAGAVAAVWQPSGPAVLGTFTQTLSYENAGGQIASVRGFGSRDIFLASLSSSGAWSAITVVGGDGVDLATDMVGDTAGNLWFSGTGYGSVRIQGPKAKALLERERGQGALVVSLSADGNLRWAGQDYSGISQGDGIALATNQEVLLAGSVAGNLRFSSGLPVASSATPQTVNGFALRLSQTDTPLVPGAVIRLVARSQGGGILATWNPPPFDGGSSVVGYDVRINGGPWRKTYRTAQSFPVPKRGAKAVVEVRAVNKVGAGPASTVTLKLRRSGLGGT